MNYITKFTALSYSVPLIRPSLLERDISFKFFVSASNFWRKLNRSLTHSGDFNPCAET